MQTWPHGPPTLRPFPDEDAPISCSGNVVRLTTVFQNQHIRNQAMLLFPTRLTRCSNHLINKASCYSTPFSEELRLVRGVAKDSVRPTVFMR